MRTISAVLLIAITPAVLLAAGTGDECKLGTSNPTYLCLPGTACLQAIGSKYCATAGKVCGWPDQNGYTLGQTKEYKGKTYECFPNGFMLKHGEECKLGTSENKFLCPSTSACRKAISKYYCSSPVKVCGWRETSGYSLGQKKSWEGAEYECFANGFMPASDQSATIDIPGVTQIPTKPEIRSLSSSENTIAQKVFGKSVNLGQVRVTNTTGISEGRPWTAQAGSTYTMNVGVEAYASLAGKSWSDLLIHELTHVWQGQHGVAFSSNSAYHQTLSAIQTGSAEGAYEFTPGKQWSSYASEQQASLVERWFEEKMKTTSELYPYIRDNIIPGQPNAKTEFGDE